MARLNSQHIIDGTERMSKYYPAFVKDRLYSRFSTAITSYPTDCPAKRFLVTALERCPRDSVVNFISGCVIAQKNNIPITSAFTRLLLDQDGHPVLAAICEDLAPVYAEYTASSSQQRAEQKHAAELSRRKFLKRAGAGGLALALGAETVIGGWSSKEETGERRVDPAKISRAIGEGLSAYLLLDSSGVEATGEMLGKLMPKINAIVEKEMGVQTNIFVRSSAQEAGVQL